MAEIKNLKKAAKRIKKAVKNKERIVLYGDADLDGISCVIILKEAIKNIGGEVSSVYFPDREIEGYGLNEDALNYLKEEAPALLIVMDCSIGNFEEMKMAKALGFEVILLEHHEPLKKLPLASIIVNPKQKGDKYTFKKFAAAGIVFRLAEVLLEEKMSVSLRNNFLELVALATLADNMPREKDNLEFIGDGLISLKKTLRPGLKVFEKIDFQQQGTQKIISACHSGGNKNHLNECYLLLTSSSEDEAFDIAQTLLEKGVSRHERIREIVEEIEEKVSGKEPIIFQGDKSWPVLMLGTVASKICQIYKKPVFLYSDKKDYCQGGVRTPAKIDSVKAMTSCSKHLESYGGHPQAAGFKIQRKNLLKFETCLIKYFKKS